MTSNTLTRLNRSVQQLDRVFLAIALIFLAHSEFVPCHPHWPRRKLSHLRNCGRALKP